MAGWDPYLSERDKRLFPLIEFGRTAGFGERPVVLVVDVSYAFTGDRPEPVLESVERWPNSAGEEAWTGIAVIARLLDAARAKQPQPDDVVIEKGKPSAFFGTLLPAYLADLGADSAITCGVATSGCVRASVIDGFSYNYRMVVVEDGVFDRGEASHWISLFDMQMKYADVVPLADVLEYLDGLDDGLFADACRCAKHIETAVGFIYTTAYRFCVRLCQQECVS